MKPNTVIALVAGIFIGAGGGWLFRPATADADNPRAVPVGARTAKSPREDADDLEKTRVAKRWIDRIEAEGVEEIREQIPAGDMKGLIEKMMSTMWGGMTDDQKNQLVKLISTWAEKAPEEALAWARALEAPQQREIALASVAGTVGKKDPMAGFEIYTEIGKVTRWANGDDLDEMMVEVYKIAMAKGIAGLVDVAKRTPENDTGGSLRVQVTYPENFDFAALIDALAPLGNPRLYDQFTKPIIPTDPLGVWASRDRDAAFSYVVSRINDGRKVNMSDFISEMTRKSGSVETERWVSGRLAAMDPEQAATVLDHSGMLHDPGKLRRYIAGMPEDSAAEFRYQLLRASPLSTVEILQDLPMEERLATLGRLRGVEHTQQIRFFLGQWQVPNDRIEEIVRTVGSAAE